MAARSRNRLADRTKPVHSRWSDFTTSIMWFPRLLRLSAQKYRGCERQESWMDNIHVRVQWRRLQERSGKNASMLASLIWWLFCSPVVSELDSTVEANCGKRLIVDNAISSHTERLASGPSEESKRRPH